jgi:CheY-like chemotaxis protein
VFRWVALGGAFEGQEGRSTPRFFSPCGLAFDRQAPQLFSYPARYYTYLQGVVPEIVEALVLPLPDGTGTVWITTHDEAIRFDSEHVRLLPGLATFMATSLKLLRLTHQAQRARGGTERDLTPQHGGTVAAASPGPGFESAFATPLPLPRQADPVERGAANVPTVVTKNAGNALVEAHGLAQAEQQRDTPFVTRRTEMNELLLAYRALVEQVRLVSRDGRRLIRRLIAVCEPSKGSRVPMTSSPTPLASVPLVLLSSTTEREQIELNGLVQSLSAEGYQVAGRGPQWVVYTEITDRRTSVIGESPRSRRGIAASERVQSGSLRHRRRNDSGMASAAPLAPTVLIVDDDRATVDSFAQVLHLEGYEVRTAFSVESGIRAVQASRPDAILVDFMMPLANGIEFLRRLRADEDHRDTPVAIVTGDYSLDDTIATELHQLGASVAFKPLLYAELVDLTRRLLAGRASIH